MNERQTIVTDTSLDEVNEQVKDFPEELALFIMEAVNEGVDPNDIKLVTDIIASTRKQKERSESEESIRHQILSYIEKNKIRLTIANYAYKKLPVRLAELFWLLFMAKAKFLKPDLLAF